MVLRWSPFTFTTIQKRWWNNVWYSMLVNKNIYIVMLNPRQGVKARTFGRQNERNFCYDLLALTSIFGLCFMSVCLMKLNYCSLIYSSLNWRVLWLYVLLCHNQTLTIENLYFLNEINDLLLMLGYSSSVSTNWGISTSSNSFKIQWWCR